MQKHKIFYHFSIIPNVFRSSCDFWWFYGPEHMYLNKSTDHDHTAPNRAFSTGQSESEFLLVIHPMTFIYQDLWYGKLVPNSHQRGEPSHIIFCTFRWDKNQIWRGIPIYLPAQFKIQPLPGRQSCGDVGCWACVCVGGGGLGDGGGGWGGGRCSMSFEEPLVSFLNKCKTLLYKKHIITFGYHLSNHLKTIFK